MEHTVDQIQIAGLSNETSPEIKETIFHHPPDSPRMSPNLDSIMLDGSLVGPLQTEDSVSIPESSTVDLQAEARDLATLGSLYQKNGNFREASYNYKQAMSKYEFLDLLELPEYVEWKLSLAEIFEKGVIYFYSLEATVSSRQAFEYFPKLNDDSNMFRAKTGLVRTLTNDQNLNSNKHDSVLSESLSSEFIDTLCIDNFTLNSFAALSLHFRTASIKAF